MSSARSTGTAIALTLLVGVGIGVLVREISFPDQEFPHYAATDSSRPAPAVAPVQTHEAAPEARQSTAPAKARERPNAGERPDGPTEEDVKRSFEARFVSEPVSPSWAKFNEKQVNTLLQTEALVAEGLEAPIFHDVECRSTLCRLDLVARDQLLMELTQLRVLQGISDSLGTAYLFHEPQADGTVVLVMYASTRPVKP